MDSYFIFPKCFNILCTSLLFLTDVWRPLANKWCPKEFLLTVKPEACQKKCSNTFLKNVHFHFHFIRKKNFHIDRKYALEGLWLEKKCSFGLRIQESLRWFFEQLHAAAHRIAFIYVSIICFCFFLPSFHSFFLLQVLRPWFSYD